MSDAALFNAARALAILIGLASTMLTFAANAPDLGWSKQQIAYAMMANQGLSYVLLVLPQVQKRAGNVRGNSADD